MLTTICYSILILNIQAALLILKAFKLILGKVDSIQQKLKLKLESRPGLKVVGQFARLQLGKIHFLSIGRQGAPLVVMINGELGNLKGWLPIAKLLSMNNCQVLMFDHYGTGMSDSPLVTCDINQYVQTTMELLEYLGFDHRPLCVVGHGFGGQVALSIASEYPERVSRLICLSTGGFAPSAFDWNTLPSYLTYQSVSKSEMLTLMLLQSWAMTVLAKALVLPYLQSLFKPDNEEHKSLLAAYLAHHNDINSQLAYQILKTPRYLETLAATLTSIKMYGPIDDQVLKSVANHPKRVLLINGSHDQVVPKSSMPQFSRHMKHAQCKVVRNGGHQVHTSKPYDVAKMVQAFMQQ